MKTGTILLIGAGAGLLYYISQLGIATNTVSILFEGIQAKSLTDFIVTMRIQNVSNVSVNVNSMTGTLSLFSNPVANLSDFTQRTVPANGQVDIQLEAAIDLLNLPATIQSVFQNAGSELDFTIAGNANVSGLVLPFSLDKSISV